MTFRDLLAKFRRSKKTPTLEERTGSLVGQLQQLVTDLEQLKVDTEVEVSRVASQINDLELRHAELMEAHERHVKMIEQIKSLLG